MSDSAAIDSAIIAKLLADAPLMTLAADGVWWDLAPQNSTRFVIVSLTASLDTDMFQSRAFEEPTYLVKFVEKSNSDVNARSAAIRIDAVLDRAMLSPAGYSPAVMSRSERVRYTELDEANARWQHSGGLYALMASP